MKISEDCRKDIDINIYARWVIAWEEIANSNTLCPSYFSNKVYFGTSRSPRPRLISISVNLQHNILLVNLTHVHRKLLLYLQPHPCYAPNVRLKKVIVPQGLWVRKASYTLEIKVQLVLWRHGEIYCINNVLMLSKKTIV